MASKTLVQQEHRGLLERVSLNGHEVLRVRVPCEVRITPRAGAQLARRTPRTRESGGLLGARPLLVDGHRALSVEKICVVRNISKSPRVSYRPDMRLYKARLRRLVEVEGLVPISYHTHPAPRGDTLNSVMKYYLQMGTSGADQFMALEVARFGEEGVVLPQAVVVRDPLRDGVCAIGVYGGLVAPLDFMQSIQGATADIVVSVVDGVAGWFKSPSVAREWKALAIALLALFGVACLLKPKLLVGILLVLMISSAGALPLMQSQVGQVMNHFGTVTSSSGARLALPGPAPVSPIEDAIEHTMTVRRRRVQSKAGKRS